MPYQYAKVSDILQIAENSIAKKNVTMDELNDLLQALEYTMEKEVLQVRSAYVAKKQPILQEMKKRKIGAEETNLSASRSLTSLSNNYTYESATVRGSPSRSINESSTTSTSRLQTLNKSPSALGLG